MIALISIARAHELLAKYCRDRRLAMGLTQQGLAKRSDVKLASVRKFEQKGLISLSSFLRLAMVLGCLAPLVDAMANEPQVFTSMEEVLRQPVVRKRGHKNA